MSDRAGLPATAVLGLTTATALCLAAGGALAAQERRPEGPDRLVGFVGAGVGIVPKYEGANDYKFMAGPVFDLRYGRLYANLWDGIGVDVISTDRFEAGLGLTYVRGRKAKHSPEGVGKVKSTVGSHAYARYYLTQEVSLTAGVTHAYGGTDGTLADLTLSYRFRPSKQVMLLPSVSATWASGRHMQRYFGINEQQALRSGLPEFEADSGIKDVSASLTTIYSLSRHWHVSATVGLERFLGDAADSPLNERKWQPAGAIGIAYRF